MPLPINSLTLAIFSPKYLGIQQFQIESFAERCRKNLDISMFDTIDQNKISAIKDSWLLSWSYKWLTTCIVTPALEIPNILKEITLSLNLGIGELREQALASVNSSVVKFFIWMVWSFVKSILLPLHIVTCCLAFAGHSVNRLTDTLFEYCGPAAGVLIIFCGGSCAYAIGFPVATILSAGNIFLGLMTGGISFLAVPLFMSMYYQIVENDQRALVRDLSIKKSNQCVKPKQQQQQQQQKIISSATTNPVIKIDQKDLGQKFRQMAANPETTPEDMSKFLQTGNNRQFLNQAGPTTGMTALHRAMQGNHQRVALRLLEWNADYTLKDREGKTALDFFNELPEKDSALLVFFENRKVLEKRHLEEIISPISNRKNN